MLRISIIHIAYFLISIYSFSENLPTPKRIEADEYSENDFLENNDIIFQFDEASIKDTYIRNEGLYENDNFDVKNELHISDRQAQGGGDRRIRKIL